MGHPVVHFEIGCRDKARTAAFFSQLFGWTMQPMGPATLVDTGGPGGISGHLTSLGHEPHHYLTVYVQVEELASSIERATALGGSLLVPPVEIPTGHFAWIADPDGNTIGLFKPKAEAAPAPRP